MFTAQSVVEWRQRAVAEEIPTHQSIAGHGQDTGVGGFDSNGRQVGTGCIHNSKQTFSSTV